MEKLSSAVPTPPVAAEVTPQPPVTQERLRSYMQAGEFVKAERLLLTETLRKSVV